MAMHFSKEDWEKLKKDSSEIYQKREDGQGRMSSLSGKEKWRRFREYYLKGCIFLVLAVVFAVFGIMKVTAKTAHCALYIAVQGGAVSEGQLEQFAWEAGDYLGFDPEEKFVMVDTACSGDELETYFNAGTADILIADEETFAEWAGKGFLCAAGRDKGAEFYREYEDKYLCSLQNESAGGAPEGAQAGDSDGSAAYQCGIYLTDSGRYRQMGGKAERPVIGIFATTRRQEQSEKFVRYMMGE